MDYNKLHQYLESSSNISLKNLFSNLIDQKSLDQAFLNLDLKSLSMIRDYFFNSNRPIEAKEIFSLKNLIHCGNKDANKTGLNAMKKGQCATIVLAGGQGTRLNFNGPKGLFPISLVRNKSLFQLLAEKTLAASRMTRTLLPLGVLCSPLNIKETESFFHKKNFFGLHKDQVVFFTQTMLPFLNMDGKLLAQSHTKIAQGPDGNGSVFAAFNKSGFLKKWIRQGVKYINIIQIDNPLAAPYDPELFGHLIQAKSDVAIKSCLRKHPKEKVGIIIERENKPQVIEYHEIPEDLKFEQEPPANLSLMALTTSFFEKTSSLTLPLHKVQKKCTFYDYEKKQLIHPEKPNIWKFEKYLFDILPASTKTTVVLYPREEVFSPLKNAFGDDSIESVRQDLWQKERLIYRQIFQKNAPEKPFELSADFYYPSKEFLKRVKNIPSDLPYLF